jgi:vesicle-fusing ATPase
MRQNGKLSDDVNIDELARLTKNYTGAEIESVCKSATSYALWQENNQLGPVASASKPSGEESKQ